MSTMSTTSRIHVFTGAILIAMICMAAIAHAEAQPTNPFVWEPQVRGAHVYKNGFLFIEEAAEVSLRDGWCYLARTVPAAFGSLWLRADDDTLTASEVKYDPEGHGVAFDAQVNREVELAAHTGLDVVLTYTRHGDTLRASGRLDRVVEAFVILEGEKGTSAIPIEGITHLRAPGMPVRIRMTRAGAPAERVHLTMFYLTQGMRWIPEYTLDLADASTARLTMRGTLRNEAMDLGHADVHFVVGVPHFSDAQTGAPLFNGTPAMNDAAMLTGSSQSLPWFVDNAPVNAAMPPAQGALRGIQTGAGDTEGEFTIYTKPGLSVRKGENTAVLLFSADVAYEHVYRWQVGQPVEHYLRLHNDTSNAWTTGACLMMNGARPLSQDKLRYTARGAAAEVPVAMAINIACSAAETEIDRKLKAYTISEKEGTALDRVEVEGTLTLVNHEGHAAEVRIQHHVAGMPLSASDGANTYAVNPGAMLTERRGSLSWTVTVPPGERKSLNYRYERYVPSA